METLILLSYLPKLYLLCMTSTTCETIADQHADIGVNKI